MLQSQTVYSNVSKGVVAKSKDLVAAFGTDDQSKICLEVCQFCFSYISLFIVLTKFASSFFWLLDDLSIGIFTNYH